MRRMHEERRDAAHAQAAEMLALQIEKLTLEHLPHASVSTIAEALDMGERMFFRRASDLGVKPGNIIRETKLKRAKLLLAEGDKSFSEVAQHVGYSTSHLRKLLSSPTQAI